MKNEKTLGLGLVVLLLLCIPAFAEDITISTYYPSPYGSYGELQSNKLAVGDTNGDGALGAGDLPPANGTLYVEKSVILKPQASFPSFADSRPGELVYYAPQDSLYLYNGSAWVAASGGGPEVMNLACGWGITFAYSGPTFDTNGSCTPPSCPSGWTLESTFSEPVSITAPGSIIFLAGRTVNVCTK